MRGILRAILREPTPVIGLVLSLAIGLGASVAVFAFLDHIWLVPLPYPDPDRIIRIWEKDEVGEVRLGVNYPHYLTLLDNSESIEQIALYWNTDVQAAYRGVSVKSGLAAVTPQFFQVLGVRPAQGDWLNPEPSEEPEREAVISERLWRRLFGDGQRLGEFIEVNGVKFSVIGRMPDHFAYPSAETEIWVPFRPPPADEASKRFSNCLARMTDGVGPRQAAAEVARFSKRSTVRVVTLADELYRPLSQPLQWLGGGIAVVLLIALLNAATLQFARISRRWKDFGIRAALGASPRRLAGELLAESLLLTATGAVGGFAIFSSAFTSVTRNWPGEIPGMHHFSLWAGRPLILLVVATVVTALLMTGLSLLFVRRLHAVNRFQLSSEAAPFASFRVRFNSTIVSAQLAASAVLLICSGMLISSFVSALWIDLGYEPDGVLAARIELSPEKYPNRIAQLPVLDSLLERFSSIESVTAVSFSSTLPSTGGSEMTVELPSSGQTPKVTWAQVTPGYFEALGLRLIQGRLFSGTNSGQPELVVNRSFARAYLPPDPIGQKALLGPGKSYRVVGVVSDVLQDGYLGHPEPALYYHYLEPPQESFLTDLNRGHLIVRLRDSPQAFAPTLRALLGTPEIGIQIEWVRAMEDILAEQVVEPRFWTLLAVGLGLVGLLFSSVALYAMVSFSVGQRTSEFAIRMTLGATPHELIRMVMRSAGWIIGRSLLLGVTVSLAVSALFADVLFGAERLGPMAWIVALGILSAAGLAAAYFPAKRGTEVSPSVCLRE